MKTYFILVAVLIVSLNFLVFFTEGYKNSFVLSLSLVETERGTSVSQLILFGLIIWNVQPKKLIFFPIENFILDVFSSESSRPRVFRKPLIPTKAFSILSGFMVVTKKSSANLIK